MLTSQPHVVGTGRRGGRDERSREMETRPWTAGKVVRGFASALFSLSGLALSGVGATTASAATPSCEQSLSSTSAWDHTGGWKSNDGGSAWADSSESLSPETLSRCVSNLATSGAQFTFDWSWDGTDGASQAAVAPVSCGSTVGSTATIGVQATESGTADSTLTSTARGTGPLTEQDTSKNGSPVTTSVDETLGGSPIDSSVAVGAFGAVSLAVGITGWRRRASRGDV